jgi:hypothetical protein
VVPFFGDQFFWGRIVANAGAGPEPIPIRRLDAAALTAAFDACRRPQIRARASELGARLRATDGVELAVQSIERHLPAAVMCCSRDEGHLAVLYCEGCRTHLCEACWRSEHPGHMAHPYRYVDWSSRPPHGLLADVGELIGDAAYALGAGLAELLPSAKPRQQGVVFSDGDESTSTGHEGPVRKLRRWLHLS